MSSKDPITEFIELMAIETVNITKTYIKRFSNDPDKVRILTSRLVSEIIAELVMDCVASYDKKASKKNQLAQVETNFLNMKRAIQTHVADGMNKAVYTYYGQDLDYYCHIKIAKETHEKKVLQ